MRNVTVVIEDDAAETVMSRRHSNGWVASVIVWQTAKRTWYTAGSSRPFSARLNALRFPSLDHAQRLADSVTCDRRQPCACPPWST